MIFRIGEDGVYFRASTDASRVGRPHLEPPGVPVWRTALEAMDHLVSERMGGHSVWAVDARWGRDVQENRREPFGRLLVASPVTGRVIPSESVEARIALMPRGEGLFA